MVCVLFLTASLSLAAQTSISLASGRKITTAVTPTRAILHLAGSKLGVALERDATVGRGAQQPQLELVAEIPGSTVLFTDTYASLSGGIGYCQAGEERFLRVLTLVGKRPRETFHMKLASCRNDIELADPGLQWSPVKRTLTIEWLTPPEGRPKRVDLVLDSTGHPTIVDDYPR